MPPGDETEPTRIGHRRRQRGSTGPAGHGCTHDGHGDVPEAQHHLAQYHSATPATASAGTARVRRRSLSYRTIARSCWGSDRLAAYGPRTAAPYRCPSNRRATALTSSTVT